jgi:hypothetical protein
MLRYKIKRRLLGNQEIRVWRIGYKEIRKGLVFSLISQFPNPQTLIP